MPDVTESPLAGPVEHDPETDTHRARYEWSSPVPLTTAVVEVIAEVTDVDPREVTRLTYSVDPEALDSIFAPAPDSPHRRDGRLTFVLEGHRVTVHGTGEIEVGRVRRD